MDGLWQNASMTKLLMTALLLTQTLPTGYWPLEKSQPLIEKTQTIRLTSDLSKLSKGERKAVAKLIEAGQIFQKLYEEQRHPQALSSLPVACGCRHVERRTPNGRATSSGETTAPIGVRVCTPFAGAFRSGGDGHSQR